MKILILLFVALVAKASAFHNVSNCTEEFQAALLKVIDIKNHCNIKGFYDCCEVIHHSVILLSGWCRQTYTIMHVKNTAACMVDTI